MINTAEIEHVKHSAERMKKPKSICRPSNTGEKYISLYKKRNKTTYRVFGKKSFSTLHVAIEYRNGVIFDGEK